MSDDIEDELRVALTARTAHISHETLLRPTSPVPRRDKRPIILIVAAATAVIVLAGGITAARLHWGPTSIEHTAATPLDFNTIANVLWAADTVYIDGSIQQVPASVRVTVEFKNGRVDFDDGSSTVGGSYQPAPAGFVLGQMGIYDVHPADPAFPAGVTAVARLTISRQPADVIATISAGQLALSRGGATIRYHEDGVAPSVATADPGAVAAAPAVGGHWQAIDIHVNGRTFDVPASLTVTIDLAPTGQLSINDGLNTTSGPYWLTSKGLRLGYLSKSMLGYEGKDPVMFAAQQAISDLTDGSPDVTAAVHDDTTFTLVRGQTSITYHRQGNVPPEMTAPAVDTSGAISSTTPTTS